MKNVVQQEFETVIGLEVHLQLQEINLEQDALHQMDIEF